MKKTLLTIIVVAFAVANVAFAEDPPTLVWNKVFDSGGSDKARGVAVDSDGNVYVTGFSDNGTGRNFRTIKYDSEGNILWNKVYDSGGGDYAYGVAVDTLGNVYVTGHSGGGYRTIKYDSEGNILWNKVYDSGNSDYVYGVAVADAGNVYVTGFSYNGTDNDYRTICYDSDGNLQWNKIYDSGDFDIAFGVAVDDDGYVYVTGNSYDADADYRTICYDSEGNIQWNKVYDSGDDDRAYGVAVDTLGNVYVTGFSDNGTDDDYRTICYDSEGNIQWNKVYDSGDNDEARGVAVDSDGYVYVTGWSYNGTDDDYRTIKYKQDGEITLTSPNGGEQWVIGEVYNITWDSEGVIDSVMIEYLNESMVGLDTIAVVANTGSYAWTVPNTPGTQTRVYVSDVADYAGVRDTSDADFAIINGGITLTSPNGGEEWVIGEAYNITWDSEGFIDSVMIEYLNESVVGLDTIAVVANTGTYSWTVPNTPGTQTRVYVSDVTDYAGVRDASDADFAIVAEGVEEEISTSLSLEVFPDGLIRYSVPQATDASLKIYAVDGSLVYSREITSEKGELRCDQLASGVYFTRLVVESESITKKIIIIK